MFVAAAAGAAVAKHGNRAGSSKSGSADVLERLGIKVMLSPEQISACLAATGIGFMFAPNHHPATQHIAAIRKEMGVRTLFNLLGPLTNPASAPHQLLGVFHAELVGVMARVLQKLGSQHVLVVHGADGLDEISLNALTYVAELKEGCIEEYVIEPETLGFRPIDQRALCVANAEESSQLLLSALEGKAAGARDIVIMNAGAALYAANKAVSLAEGIQLARESIASGAARAKVDELIKFTKNFN